MKSALELQEQRGKALNELRALRLTTPDGTPEGWEKALEDIQGLDSRIKAAKAFEDIERIALETQAEGEAREKAERDSKKPDNVSATYEDVFWRYMTRGKEARMSEADTRLLETRGTSTQIGATDSLGGYLVPQSFSNTLENMMLHYGGMMEACGVYQDNIGGTLTWPTGDDTSVTGAITSEGSAMNVSDLTFGQVTFGDYSIDSNIIKVSRELIQDNRVNLLQKVLSDNIGRRLGSKVNTVLTSGTGTGEPYGLTVASTSTGITTASATAITKAELIKHVHTVDRAYRFGPNVGWMMNDETVGYLRTLDATTDTTHLFVDTIIDNRLTTSLLGYPIFVNNDLTALTSSLPVASTKHIYFGDFSKYIIRKIAPVSIERNDQLYWASKTVGFMGWLRLDGNLINQNAIKALIQHS